MENFKSFKKNCVSSEYGFNYVQFDKVLSTYCISVNPNISRYIFSYSNYLILVDIENVYNFNDYKCYSVLSLNCSYQSFVPLYLLFKSFRNIIRLTPNAQCLGVRGFAFNDDFERVIQFRSFLHRCLTRLS